MNKSQSRWINTIFLLFIFFFTIANIVRPLEERSETENRILQMPPSLTLSGLFAGEFSSDYENYLSDQFVARDKWIMLKTTFERITLNQEADDVYFAKDNYLIEKHSGTFTSDTSAENIDAIGVFMQMLIEKYDSEHLTCIVVPNAVDILSDKLPAFADPYDEEDYLDKIEDLMPEGVWLDASDILSAHYLGVSSVDASIQTSVDASIQTSGDASSFFTNSADQILYMDTENEISEGVDSPDGEMLYYRTDHHWKTLSAYYVYEQWLLTKGLGSTCIDQYHIITVTDSFEGTIASKLGIHGKADSIERFDPVCEFDYYITYNKSDEVWDTFYHNSYLQTKDKYAYFFGGNFGLIEIEMPDGRTGRKLLIIKDSYAHCFAPFVCANFDEVDMVDPRYYNASIRQLMEAEEYTDVLFLFNASGFAEETAISRLLS